MKKNWLLLAVVVVLSAPVLSQAYEPMGQDMGMTKDQPKKAEQKTSKSTKKHKKAAVKAEKYTCPMHPNVVSDKPGKCPECGMDLEKVSSTEKPKAM